MADVERRLSEMGLVLPAPLKTSAGRLPFTMARVVGQRVLVAGHGPLNPDGSLAPPFGKVGREVSAAEAYAAARLTGLAILASLKRAIGMAELPFNAAVEIEAEVEIAS